MAWKELSPIAFGLMGAVSGSIGLIALAFGIAGINKAIAYLF